MQCFSCKKEYDGTAISQRNSLLESFFPGSLGAALKQAFIGPLSNENLSVISRYFNDRLFSDPGFRHEYAQLREQYYAIKIKCSQCGQELYYGGLHNVEHAVYSTLFEAEYTFLVQQLSIKCGRDVQNTLELIGDKREIIEFAIRNLDGVLGDTFNVIKDNHAFIEDLRYKGGRGGDFVWGTLAVIRDYLTNEFVKNAIYDLVKSSGIFLLGCFVHKIRDKGIKKSAEEKLQELSVEKPSPYANDLSLIFQYLTEKEKAALSKKLVARIAKEKLRAIRKLIK